jgi:NitT/TauT family transport system substrate-binding protein
MYKKIILSLFILFFLSSCELKHNKKLRISITPWIGYTPLLYAKEKSWLNNLDIKLLTVVSLSENMYLYKAGNSDVYVGTQYEYNVLSQKDKTLFPIMMFNRSNGGDIVMGNLTIEQFQNLEKPIDIYLEMDSINSVILADFVKKYKLENKVLNYKNKDQSSIAQLNTNKITNPTLIITYIPYDVKLKGNGFKELSSTKDNLNLVVVDAMFTTKDVLDKHKEKFHKLKRIIDKSIINLKNDPKEYYEKIKKYIPQTNYQEFLSSLDDIVWINENPSQKLLERLRESNFPTRNIIK